LDEINEKGVRLFLPIRGGSWNNGDNAGLAALNLNYERSNVNNNVGFRPALACSRIRHSNGMLSARRQKELYSRARRAQTGSIGLAAMSTPVKGKTAASYQKTESIMPVTYNNLWKEIASFESLYEGYRAAARNKRFSDSALNYRQRLEENIINTLNMLIWKEWRPSPYREFHVYDPKKRLISAPPFKDRVVHHALVKVLEPLFERKFIADSFACRAGKGTHAAKQRVEAFAASAQRRYPLLFPQHRPANTDGYHQAHRFRQGYPLARGQDRGR
jgi:hypothetical protein